MLLVKLAYRRVLSKYYVAHDHNFSKGLENQSFSSDKKKIIKNLRSFFFSFTVITDLSHEGLGALKLMPSNPIIA